MATWPELRAFIESNYRISKVDGNTLTLVFGTANNRSQLIFVTGVDMDRGVALFASPFANVTDISPAQFAACSENTFLGIRRIGDLYTVVHMVPLENADASEVEWAMAFVVSAADELERSLGLGDTF
jgi:hypothetical protein